MEHASSTPCSSNYTKQKVFLVICNYYHLTYFFACAVLECIHPVAQRNCFLSLILAPSVQKGATFYLSDMLCNQPNLIKLIHMLKRADTDNSRQNHVRRPHVCLYCILVSISWMCSAQPPISRVGSWEAGADHLFESEQGDHTQTQTYSHILAT